MQTAQPINLVAGTPGQPPGYADGKGKEARFTAPHDLEGDAEGLLYLIDAGRIRTVDQKDWQVRTLDNTALNATSVFKTLDSDRLGRVHAIEQINNGRYVYDIILYSWMSFAMVISCTS